MGQYTVIEDYAWIYPYVALTNDRHPPVYNPQGVTIKKYAVVSTSSVIMPGVVVGENALVGAHSVVTKNIEAEMLVLGNPARVKCSVSAICAAVSPRAPAYVIASATEMLCGEKKRLPPSDSSSCW